MRERFDDNQVTYWLLIATIFLSVAVFSLACDGGIVPSRQDDTMYRNLAHIGVGKHLANFKHSITTPGGVKVRSTVPVPANALAEIDAGIQRTINQHSAVYPTWNKKKTLPEWNVLFIEPMATNVETEPGSPAILVQGQQSCGTVIGINYLEAALRETQYLVLPHQAATNWRYTNYLKDCADNEADHYFEFVNNYEIFVRWNANDIHPRPFHLCGTDPNLYPC